MSLEHEDELLEAVTSNAVSQVTSLLEDGADANAGLFRGEATALSIAVRNGREDIIDLLLNHRCNCCMVEQIVEPPVPSPGAIISLSNPSALVETARSLLWGAGRTHMFLLAIDMPWFSLAIILGGLSSLEEKQPVYRPPSSGDTIGIGGRLSGDYDAAVKLGIHFLGLRQDMALSIPIYAAVSATVGCLRWIGVQTGYIKPPNPVRPATAATAAMAAISRHQDWQPPAKLVLDTLLESPLVTSSIVLKLLRAEMLVARPYNTSQTARVLCTMAIKRCWNDVLRYIVDEGAVLDSQDTEISENRIWPPMSKALAHILPTKDAIQFAPELNEGLPIRDPARRLLWADSDPIPAFHILIESENFQRLACSSLEEHHAQCEDLMDILVDAGADAFAIHRKQDLAARLVVPKPESCSTRVLRHFLSLHPERSRRRPPGALHCALNSIRENTEHVQLLLQNDYLPNEEDSRGFTPLHVATYMNGGTDTMKLLLERGADPNDGGSEGSPPLIRALHDNSLDKFLFLLEYGAYKGLRYDGKSLLTNILQLSDTVVVLKYHLVKVLQHFRAFNVYEPETDTCPALCVGVAQGVERGHKTKILDILVDNIPEEHLQAQLDKTLYFCCKPSEPRELWTVKVNGLFYLLDKGADPSIARQGEDNLLYLICSESGYPDHEHHEQFKVLLKQGVLDINAPGNRGWRPLHVAIRTSQRDFALLLLEHGADTSIVDDEGLTPMQTLCSRECPEYDISFTLKRLEGCLNDTYYEGHRGQAASGFTFQSMKFDIKRSLGQEEMLQSLLHHDADPLAKNRQGQNSLMLACKKGNTILVAGILQWLSQPKRSSMAALKTALYAKDNNGNSCFHLVAMGGHHRTLKVLLGLEFLVKPITNHRRLQAVRDEDSSASKQSSEEEQMRREEISYYQKQYAPSFLRGGQVTFEEPGDVTFSIGGEWRKEEECITLPNVYIDEWDIKRSIVVTKNFVLASEKNHQGKTPLHLAARRGHSDFVNVLLEITDQDVSVTDNQGRTAADCASEGNHFDIYSVLENLR
ncbi:ankyrin-1 [Fusarium albosuccineum]|uniref:Ankyrin-1 n=1 Tax=Fusarium albosuccineum TaxID=1237068 RepID=A0A8H4KLR0_9HYPO|nr:ankyrin-1 [Fusarium albosuccineum]